MFTASNVDDLISKSLKQNFEKSLPIKLAFVHCIVIQDCAHKYELSTHDTYSFLRGT